jgi:hypothetical protein
MYGISWAVFVGEPPGPAPAPAADAGDLAATSDRRRHQTAGRHVMRRPIREDPGEASYRPERRVSSRLLLMREHRNLLATCGDDRDAAGDHRNRIVATFTGIAELNQAAHRKTVEIDRAAARGARLDRRRACRELR